MRTMSEVCSTNTMHDQSGLQMLGICYKHSYTIKLYPRGTESYIGIGKAGIYKVLYTQ